jgi:hypothetical protein
MVIPGTDGGPRPDGGGGPGEDACEAPGAVALTVGAQQITGDTTGGGTTLDLGEGCGSAEGVGPQQAFALTLPAGGTFGVELSMVNEGTAMDLDTLVQLRRGGCESLDDAQCFDDTGFGEVRSSGTFTAEGGSTVHLIVSGYDAESAGPFVMDVTVSAVSPPVLGAVSAQRVDGMRFDIAVSGTDPEGDAAGIAVTFLDDAGAAIGVDTDEDPETPAVTDFQFGFTTDLEGMTTFDAVSRVEGIDDFPALVTAASVRVALIDEFDARSAEMTAEIADVMESGRGEPCGTDRICADAFECTAEVCAIPAATTTACGAATAITITTGAATVTERVTGSIPAGDGLLLGSCGDTSGAEVLYTVTVPAGDWDLIATTANETTGAADTVVHLQSMCGDPGTEVGCNDDATPGEVVASNTVVTNIEAGTYTLAVEHYGPADAAVPFALDVSLRPVLAAGAACDPAGVMNRCVAAACPASGTAVCPE